MTDSPTDGVADSESGASSGGIERDASKVGIGCVLYGDRSDGRKHSAHGTRDLWHVVDKLQSERNDTTWFRLEDGSHTCEEWYRAADLLGDFTPAGWQWPPSRKPLYFLTRRCGVEGADLMTDGGQSMNSIDKPVTIKPPRVVYECGCVGYCTGIGGAPSTCPDHDQPVDETVIS